MQAAMILVRIVLLETSGFSDAEALSEVAWPIYNGLVRGRQSATLARSQQSFH